jgi:SAM-dependent methyltransferase
MLHCGIFYEEETLMTDPYARLAAYYDIENADLVDDLHAYAVLADRFGGPVLDVGCGTGRVAFHLAAHRLRVVGVDTSPAMLERARERSAHLESDPAQLKWVEADITQLALDEDFGLAIFAYNGFMHLLAQADQIAALERIRAHLKPGGGVALDLPNPVEMFQAEDLSGLIVERIFTNPASGATVIQQSLARLDRAEQIMELTWVYDSVEPDGTTRRDLVPLRLRYTLAPEMRLLLDRAGLQVEGLYGDYDFNPYEEESPRLFVVATRAR